MSLNFFIFFLCVAVVLLILLLSRIDTVRVGRCLIYVATLGMFFFAGFRSQSINSDTRSYASYGVHFQHSSISDDDGLSDRLELGFRVLLNVLAKVLPEGSDISYPLFLNITLALLSGIFLCFAAAKAEEKSSAVLLIYMSGLFFIHQFSIVRLGLAFILFLNYFIYVRGKHSVGAFPIVCLVIGSSLHYTLLILTVLLLSFESIIRAFKRTDTEILFSLITFGASCAFGLLFYRLAPLFLSGYHLYVVTSNQGRGASAKALFEVAFGVLIFLYNLRVRRWRHNFEDIRWRAIFYLMITSSAVEIASGLSFVGRFRILCYSLFLIQTALITSGLNFKKTNTWFFLTAAVVSIVVQFVAISNNLDWQVIS